MKRGLVSAFVVAAVAALTVVGPTAGAYAATEVTPDAPLVTTPTCADPTEVVSYVDQPGVSWTPTDQASLTLQPNGGTVTSVASPTDSTYTFPAGAQTSWTNTNTFDPSTMCPVANADAIKIWPVHRYNITDQVLKNDQANGGTLQITGFTDPSNTLIANVSLNKTTHQLFVQSFKRTSKPKTVTFTYTVTRLEDGATSTVTDTITLRAMFMMRVKLISGHRMKFINRNSTYVRVRDWYHSTLLKKFRVRAHSYKIVKRPHVRNMWDSHLGVYNIPLNFAFVNPW